MNEKTKHETVLRCTTYLLEFILKSRYTKLGGNWDPVLAKLKTKSEARMKTVHRGRKKKRRGGDQTSFSPELVLTEVSPPVSLNHVLSK